MPRLSKCDEILKKYPIDFCELRRLFNKKIHKRPQIFSLLGNKADPRWTAKDKAELLLLYYPYSETDLLLDCFYYDEFDVFSLLCNSNNGDINFETLLVEIFNSLKTPRECYKYYNLFIDTSKDPEFMMLLCVQVLLNYGAIEKNREEKGDCVNSLKHFDVEKHTKLLKYLIFHKRKNLDTLNRILLMAIINGTNYGLIGFLIKLGADVNFQLTEYDSSLQLNCFRSPLKLAIDKNTKEVVDLLCQNGASLEKPDDTPQMSEYIKRLGSGEEKQTHRYHYFYDRIAFSHCTKSPIEYAVNLDDALIMNCKSSIGPHPEKFIDDRVAIVKTIYNATLAKESCGVDYTSLICFSINADNKESIIYYFEEAKERHQELDFQRIINSIHTPGKFEVQASTYVEIVTTPIFFQTMNQGASEWFKICYNYSKELDENNHRRNVILMLRQIFKICFFGGNIEQYKDLITQYSNELTTEELINIPGIFGVNLESFKEIDFILSLGYDINCISFFENGFNILMCKLHDKKVTIPIIEYLVEKGLNIDYQAPDGNSALSCAIRSLPINGSSDYVKAKINACALAARAIAEASSSEICCSQEVQNAIAFIKEKSYGNTVYDSLFSFIREKSAEGVGFTGNVMKITQIINQQKN